MKKLTLSLTALLLALWPAFAGAETPAFVPLNPAAVNKKLDAAATKLNSGKAGKEEIAAILQEVAGIEDDRQQTRQQYAEELASVQKKTECARSGTGKRRKRAGGHCQTA